MRKLISLILLILSSFWAFGQTVALDQFCLKHLGERANSLKVKTYAVRMDEMEASVIVLKKDKGLVKGVLFFPSTKKALLMSGSDQLLYLRDEKGFDQGKINYSIDNQEFKGALTSSLERNMATISGSFTRDVPVIPPACFVDKWLVYHKGKMAASPVYLTLQRIGNGDLQGLIYLKNRNKSFFLSGIMVKEKIDLMVVDNQGKKIGDIYGKIDQDGHFSGNFLSKSGTKQKISTSPQISNGQNCTSDMNADFRYSIIYPKLEISEFDEEMNRSALEWTNQCKAEDKKKKQSLLQSTILNTPAAYSYVEVHCRDDRYFSGYQISYLPTNKKYTAKAINFDLRKKTFLEAKDVFKNFVQVQKMAQVESNKRLATHHLKDNTDFVKWVMSEDYGQFVLQPEGILFSSNFHPVFGQQHVLLPYSLLKPFLKSRKIAKHFSRLK